MLNRKMTSALALILVAGTLSVATAFAAEAQTLSFQPAAPASHMTLQLDENTTISKDGMIDFTAAENDAGMAVALPEAGYQTIALTGNETLGNTLAGFESAITFLPAEKVAMMTIPLGENRSVDNSGRITFSEAIEVEAEATTPLN